MRINFLLLLIQLPLLASASNYLDEFEKVKKSSNNTKIQRFLDKAATDEKDYPDYYATAGNYWWQLSQSVSITSKSPESGDFSLRDKGSGKEAGSISTVGRVNPNIPKKALDILSEGARRFPERADISLGLAHIQHKMGMHSECVDTLLKLLALSKKNPKSLRWTRNKALPSAPDSFIPEAVQGYSADLYRAEADALCAKLCDATVAAFPDHPFAYNIKAALATANGEQDEALRFLETASTKAPRDPLILLNLGDNYLKAGQHAKAKQAYTKILELREINDSYKSQARSALQNVEQDGR